MDDVERTALFLGVGCCVIQWVMMALLYGVVLGTLAFVLWLLALSFVALLAKALPWSI